MSLAVGLGRGAAMVAHPRAAWQTLSRRGRTALVAAYFGGAYIVTLTVLMTR